MIIVRYADDTVIGFEHEADARRFWDAMRERLREFSLSLHPDKTRLIEFGRFAAQNREKRGLGKPETFKFLGFVLICGKSRRGDFQIRRKSRRDRMRAKLQEIKGGVATANAQANPGNREMARANRRRLFRLPRRADQQRGDRCFPLPRHRSLAPASLPAQPEGTIGVAADGEAGRRFSPQAARPSSLAECALRRQTPEVGAECPNWARSDLCGGRSAMNVPTANNRNTALFNPPRGAFPPPSSSPFFGTQPNKKNKTPVHTREGGGHG